MAYATLERSEAQGLKLRLDRTAAGLVCATIVPSLLAAAALMLGAAHNSSADVPGVTAILVACGAMSILFMSLPLILWRLPHSRNPLLPCVVVGTFSGPGPFGYFALIYAPVTIVPTFVMGAIGGLVFWFVAVRGLLKRGGQSYDGG